MRRRAHRLAVVALAVLVACSGARPLARTSPSTPPASPTATPSPSPPAFPIAFDADRVIETVRALVALGPRDAVSPAYRTAMNLVAERLRSLGYSVRLQRVRVPAGRSKGVAIPSGDTFNVLADPPGFDARSPFLIVGGHLDTVAVSPGANDNASGVAVTLELARLAAAERPPTQIRFVAFGAEESRKPGALGHHYGSRAMASSLGAVERASLRGAVSIDMVGAGRAVMVCRGGLSPPDLVRAFLSRGKALGIPTAPCPSAFVKLSDHWSFEQRGFAAAWLWAGDHPTRHTARDTVVVVQRSEIERVGRVAWETLRRLRA